MMAVSWEAPIGALNALTQLGITDAEIITFITQNNLRDVVFVVFKTHSTRTNWGVAFDVQVEADAGTRTRPWIPLWMFANIIKGSGVPVYDQESE